MSQKRPPSQGQSKDIILRRLDEIEKKLDRLINADNTASTSQTLANEVTIVKGQVNKAENTIENWFQQLRGAIIAELDFVDKTTFGYLDSIPKDCGLRIVTSHLKEVEKCLRKARNCARDRPYLSIIKINKVHERWIGSKDSFFIEIGTDLKSDALGHSTHTIRKHDPKAFHKRVLLFEKFWKESQKELRRLFGEDLHKSMIFSIQE